MVGLMGMNSNAISWGSSFHCLLVLPLVWPSISSSSLQCKLCCSLCKVPHTLELFSSLLGSSLTSGSVSWSSWVESYLDPKGGAHSFHPPTETSDIGQTQQFHWLLTRWGRGEVDGRVSSSPVLQGSHWRGRRLAVVLVSAVWRWSCKCS